LAELTDEQVKLAAQIGAKAGAQAFHDSQQRVIKTAYQKRLRNTKLILQNYRFLENHVNVGLPKLDADDMEAVADIPKRELDVYSLIGYQARSKVMINYIDNVLNEYRIECESSNFSNKKRRYQIIRCLFLQKKPINRETVAGLFNVDHRTIDRSVKAAIKDLSVMLYGTDALNDML